MKKLLTILLLTLAPLAWSQSYQEKVAASKALIGKPVQSHAFYTTEKQPIDFASVNGEIVVAYFFASWCSPCYASLGSLNKALEASSPSIWVIAISLDEDWKSLKGMLAETGFSGEVWKSSDATSVLSQRMFGNFSGSLPYAIKVDKHGILQEGGSRIKTVEQWSAIINENISLLDASRL